MIKIRFSGRTGHSMLQYAFGRILAKELGQYLPSCPIVGFPNTYKEINIDKKNSKEDAWLTLPVRRRYWDLKMIEEQMSTRKNIYIKSSCANYNNFKNYREDIRNEWFYADQPYDKNKLELNNKFFIWDNGFKNIEINSIEKDDLVLNIRLGDIAHGKHSNRLLLFDYFDIILRNIKANRIFITSEEIENPVLRAFDKYSPIYFFQSDYMETFNLIRLFKRIVISQSSYSWWVAYLSSAEEIYYPIVKEGPWMVTSASDQDLRVNEDRYIYVSQKNSKIMGRFNEVSEW